MERVLVTHSPVHAAKQEKGLEKRLKTACEKLDALTPQRGPGKRQFTDEKQLKSAIDKILKEHKVERLIHCEYEKEVEKQEKYIGRGRGSEDRPKKVVEKVRYQMLKIIRNEKEIESEKKRFGWKVFVTDVPRERLSFGDIIKCYRKEYRVERIFHRLKSRLDISPVFLKRNDQISGLSHLLMLGVRVLTLMEFVVRRSLKNDNSKLRGLHPENPKKETDTPTTERLLKSFSNITLTIIKTKGQVINHLPPLSDLQKEILRRLNLDFSIYQNLGIRKSSPVLNE
jgi:transposase